MEIREYKTYNEPEILQLYASVGWTAYTDQRQESKQKEQIQARIVGKIILRTDRI